MILPAHKTRIVCTIGPASESPEVMDQLLLAGMNVARLNFSQSTSEETCQGLQFSYGVHPEKLDEAPGDWRIWAKRWVADQGVPGDYLILIEGPSPDHPDVTQRLEVIDLRS